jgi:hypothetical protein
MTQMLTLGITKAITNLAEAHAKLRVSPSSDANFFIEWKEPLPTLSNGEKAKLEQLKQRYLDYGDSGAITEGTVNLILNSPVSLIGNFGFLRSTVPS